MKSDGQCKTDQRKTKSLSEGQLWRLKKRYVLIVALENLCVHFKLMDAPDQTGERTLTGDIDTLCRYLRSRHAELIQSVFKGSRSEAAQSFEDGSPTI
ncbi:MAG: hypothetical protein ABSH48_11665 [Verrucomicrobiota bacterium]|jgi:hypothetical protein